METMVFKFDPNKVGRCCPNLNTDDNFLNENQEIKTETINNEKIQKESTQIQKENHQEQPIKNTPPNNRKSNKPTREHRINLRLNDKENQHLANMAGGMPKAKFLREWVMSGKPPRRNKELPKIDPQLMRLITSMANNLNQLTRYAHTQNQTGNPIDVLALAMSIDSLQGELQELKAQYTAGSKADDGSCHAG